MSTIVKIESVPTAKSNRLVLSCGCVVTVEWGRPAKPGDHFDCIKCPEEKKPCAAS